MYLYLDQKKKKKKEREVAQTLINSGLYTGLKNFSNGNSFTFLYCASKELNIPPLSAKCGIAQVRCFF